MYKFSYGKFITIRSHTSKPRHQKMGWCVDHMRKVSDDFIIVRENNKSNSGSHFHVLAKLKKEPHKGWYTKGVHFDVKKIGGESCKSVQIVYPSTAEEADMKEAEILRLPIEEQVMLKYNAAMRNRQSRKNRLTHVDRIWRYMCKSNPALVDIWVQTNGRMDTKKRIELEARVRRTEIRELGSVKNRESPSERMRDANDGADRKKVEVSVSLPSEVN